MMEEKREWSWALAVRLRVGGEVHVSSSTKSQCHMLISVLAFLASTQGTRFMHAVDFDTIMWSLIYLLHNGNLQTCVKS